jgi:hypothetical protein
MAWVKTSEGNAGDKPYAVYEEAINTRQISSAQYQFSSEIDFIPPGTDFQVISNTAATNLSVSTHVELWVAYERGAAKSKRYRMIQTPFITLTSELDTATKVLFRDISTYGQFPYYYLKVPSGGDITHLGTATVNNVIIVGRGSVEVIG